MSKRGEDDELKFEDIRPGSIDDLFENDDELEVNESEDVEVDETNDEEISEEDYELDDGYDVM